MKFHSKEHLEEVLERLRTVIEEESSEAELVFLLRDFDWLAELATAAKRGENE